MKDQIIHESTEIVVGCYSRGRLFFECGPGSRDSQVQAARELLDQFPCLAMDGYCIYTRAEWIDGSQFPPGTEEVKEILSAWAARHIVCMCHPKPQGTDPDCPIHGLSTKAESRRNLPNKTE